MVFSTIIFLFRFLPITLALYYLAPAKLKNTVLFVCSLVFYCWGEVRFFPVMLALILINYLCGLGLEAFDAKPGVRKVLLLVALAASLGMLFYFKYANFVLRSANALLGNPLHQENIIDLAAAIEGHPDNSTPAILGGFCTSLLEYGKVWTVRVPIADKLDFVAFIPNFELSTEKARQAIPRTIPHKDAVFNLSRAALLTGSLVTGDLHNLMVAAGDRVGGVSKSRSRTCVRTLLISSGG